MHFNSVLDIPVESQAVCAAFSKDERYIVFYTKRGNLQMVGVDGTVRWHFQKDQANNPDIRLASDASTVLFQDDLAMFCYRKNGDMEWASFGRTKPRRERFCGIALSDDGRRAFLRTQGELVLYRDGAVSGRIPHVPFGGHITMRPIYRYGNVDYFEDTELVGYATPNGFHLCDSSGNRIRTISADNVEGGALLRGGRKVVVLTKQSVTEKTVASYDTNGTRFWSSDMMNITRMTATDRGIFLAVIGDKMTIRGMSLQGTVQWDHPAGPLLGTLEISSGGSIVTGCTRKEVHVLTSAGDLIGTHASDEVIHFCTVSPLGNYILYSTPKQIIVLDAASRRGTTEQPSARTKG